MELRFLTRTHYQVDEPAYMVTLLQKCTSASRSQLQERVARHFVDQLGKADRTFNFPAAGYVIDLGKHLGLLNGNLVWTDLGQLLNVVSRGRSDEYNPDLSGAERLLFFRLFLEANGASMIFVANCADQTDIFPPDGANWADFANQMFVSIYSQHLDLATDPSRRVRLRQQLDKRTRHQYSGKSGSHQTFIHMNALCRMGILAKLPGGGTRRYTTIVDSGADSQPIHRLREAVPNLVKLEEVIGARTWPQVAEFVLYNREATTICHPRNESRELQDRVINTMSETYDIVSSTGVTLCPLVTLLEAVQINQMHNGQSAFSYKELLQFLKQLQKQDPMSVHFHVDRSGRPTLVKLVPDLLLGAHWKES